MKYFFSLLIYRETDRLWSHLIPFKFSVNLLTSPYFPPSYGDRSLPPFSSQLGSCTLSTFISSTSTLPDWKQVFKVTHTCTRTQTNVCLTNFFLALVLPAGVFDTRPADYVFMLLFNWICIVVSFVCLQKAEHSWLKWLCCTPSTNVRQPVTLPLCLPPSCSTIDSRSLLLFPFICPPFLPLSLALCSTVPCHGGSTPMAQPHSTPTEYKN